MVDGRRLKVYHVRKRLGGGGKVKHRTFSSRTAAEVYLRALELEAAGIPTRLAPAAIGEVLEQFIEGRSRLGRAQVTITDYRRVTEMIKRTLGAHASIHLRADEVLAYVDARRGHGAGVARILKELSLLRTAIRRTLGPRSLSWDLPELKRPPSKRRLPPDVELGAVWAALQRADHRLAFALPLLTGIRQQDVWEATWDWLRFDPREWDRTPDHERILEVHMSKMRGRPHLVWVSSTLAGLLWGGGGAGERIVGCTPPSLHMTLYRRSLGWAHRWHGIGHLRHVAATWLAQTGDFTDAEVGLILGHAVGGIARLHYIKDLAIPLRKRAAEALEARLLQSISDPGVTPELPPHAGNEQIRAEIEPDRTETDLNRGGEVN